MPARQTLIAGLLIPITLIVYGRGLMSSPLSSGEQPVVQHAQAVAGKGRPSGRPLFFQAGGETWLQPVPVYASALASWSGVAERWASVAIASLNVALVYLIALRLSNRRGYAIAAAAIVLLTPAHLVYGRLAVDAIYPVPFVLAWVLALLAFIDRPRTWLVVAGTLSLGAGVYSQPAAPLTMAACLLITWATLWLAGHREPGLHVRALAAFALPLVAMAFWFGAHPETYPDTMGRWAMHAAHIRNPLDGFRAVTNWHRLADQSSLYWTFFDPAALFFASPQTAERATSQAPLLWPVALLLPFGVYRLVTTGDRAKAALLLMTPLVAPVAAATFGRPHAIDQALVIVPLSALLAALGAAEAMAWVTARAAGWQAPARRQYR